MAENSGDHAEARRCFQAARALDPDNIIALLWLAWLAPSCEESLLLFSCVLELDPKNERAHAGIRWARRRPAEAQAVLTTPSVSTVAPITSGPTVLPSQRRQTLIGVAAFLAQRLLFIASDAMIAISKFRGSFLGNEQLIWITYYSAQLLILGGVQRRNSGNQCIPLSQSR